MTRKMSQAAKCYWHIPLPFFSIATKKFFDLTVSLSLQVDLLVPTKVTGVITQGAKDFGRVQFVGSYKVAYSNDGERWTIYQDEKQRKDKVPRRQNRQCSPRRKATRKNRADSRVHVWALRGLGF